MRDAKENREKHGRVKSWGREAGFHAAIFCFRGELVPRVSHLTSPWSEREVAVSLQNRRNFLRISGGKGRRRGKREATAKRELRARGGSLIP